MLNSIKILDNMTKHFSRWMDIRKRTMRSTGGQLLRSVSDEIEDINVAIEEYRKDFFIRNYIEKTDEIPSQVKRALVGSLDIKEIKVEEPYVLVYNKKDFYLKEKAIMFESGFIYSKIEDVDTVIEFTYKGYKMSPIVEYFQVWNVYDEFATFVGLERYQGESNEDLLNRIFAKAENRPNSDMKGLKNAIKNSVINFEKIEDSEITIENLTADNTKKYKEYFEDILEELTFINKDVLRAKRWDVDVWSYGQASIDYIPHMWDVILKEYLDGVGYNDSLMANLSNYPSYANVNMSFYRMTEAIIDKYIAEKKLKHNIELRLTKYKDVLDVSNADYNIIATSMKNITNNNISIESYNYKEGIYNIELKDIIAEILPDTITKKSNMDLKDGDEYEIQFLPKKDYYPMNINVLEQIKEGNKENLMDKVKLSYPFVMEDGVIKNSKTIIYANKLNHFISHDNLYENKNTEELDQIDINKESRLKLNIDGAEGHYVKILYEADTTNINHKDLVLYNFEEIGNNKYKNTKKYGTIDIDTEANYISFDIKGYAEISIDGKSPVVYTNRFELEETENPRNIKIKIADFENDLEISNIKVKNYSITKTTKLGKINNINGIEILPPEKENELNIQIETQNGKHLSIEGIYIGMNTPNDKISFKDTWSNLVEYINIDTTCSMKLFRNGELISSSFSPSIEYSAKEDTLIKINLNDYEKIKYLDDVTIKEVDGEKLLLLEKNKPLSKIKIDAIQLKDRQTEKFNDIIGANIKSGEKIYITNASKEILIKDNNNEDRKILLTKDLLSPKKMVTKFINTPSDSVVKFVISESNQVTESSETTNKVFEYAKIETSTSSRHIATNTKQILNKITEDVEIIHNFLPPLAENKEMYYEIEEINKEEVRVTFHGTGTKWSINKRNLDIESLIPLNEKENYFKEVSFVNKDFILSKEIYLDRYIGDVDLTTAIIDILEEGHTLVYRSKTVEDDFNNASEYYNHQLVNSTNNNITKLKSSNIDDIIYIGYNKWNGSNNQPWEINPEDISIMKKEGILVWNNTYIEDLNIVYTIKIPSKIVIDSELLQKKVSIPIEALEKVDEREQSMEISEDTIIPIKTLTAKEFDVMKVEIDNINIGYNILDDNIIFYSKEIDPRNITINPGYYYLDGKEYYKFNEEKVEKNNNRKHVIKNNIIHKDGYLIFNKEAYNYISNSGFMLNDEDSIYYADFENDSKISTISHLGEITSCEDFNLWTNINMDVSITKGLNGNGFAIKHRDQMGYMYIDITDYINEEHVISILATENIKAYLGLYTEYTKSIDNYVDKVVPLNRISTTEIEHPLAEFKDYKRVYLVIYGYGIMDDITISKNVDHKPEFKKLNIKPIIIDENEDVIFKNVFNKAKDTKTETTNKTLQLTNSIQWGNTKKIQYNAKEDWTIMEVSNVDLRDEIIFTGKNSGYVKTPKIILDDKRIVKSVKVKINDMPIPGYTGFKVDLYTGDQYDEVDYFVDSKIGNLCTFTDQIKKYAYFKVHIPSNTIIDNLEIYIEYREDKNLAPKSIKYSQGECLTKVFDTGHAANYKLKEINFETLIERANTSIEIRAARLNDREEYIWTDWKNIEFSKQEILNDVTFMKYRLFQFRFILSDKKCKMKINNIVLTKI